MTSKPAIRILTERTMTVTPRPGETYDQVAVTYSAPPRPPGVVFLKASELPDLEYLRENPGKEIPSGIKAQGDRIRRTAIEAKLQLRSVTPGRVLQ